MKKIIVIILIGLIIIMIPSIGLKIYDYNVHNGNELNLINEVQEKNCIQPEENKLKDNILEETQNTEITSNIQEENKNNKDEKKSTIENNKKSDTSEKMQNTENTKAEKNSNNSNTNSNDDKHTTITTESSGKFDIENGGYGTYSNWVEMPEDWLDY